MFACTAALFARCAGEQGKLKEGIDMVFTSKLIEEPNGLSNPEVRDALSDAAASQFGLDAEALKECVRSQRYLTKIQDDIKEGRRLGLASTPSIWVNGRLVKGASPDVLRAVFKSVLAE
jgi:protein-disulfide isomerase